MRCDDVTRWLDEGMDGAGEAGAASHARDCAACAAAIEAARALSAAFRADAATPPPAPPDFAASVMSRIGAAAAVAEAEGARAPRRRDSGRRLPWWAVLATDPVSVVSLTLALGIGLAAAWWPDAVARAASAIVTLPAKGLLAVAAWDSEAGLSHALGGDLDPVARLAIGLAALPIVLWGAWAFYRRVERAVILLAARRGV